MEEPWANQIRILAKQQKNSIVDAKITDDHHIVLKTRDNKEIDAGLIKVKPPGCVVYIAYGVQYDEPDIYVSYDGRVWTGATSEGRFAYGTPGYMNSCCWTGDRFLAPIFQNFDYSTMIQSRDGGTWNFHRDKETFNFETSGNIFGMDASGTGVVIAVGYPYFGPYTNDSSWAISYDFGETWYAPPSYDEILAEDIYPWGSNRISVVAIKNDLEWVFWDDEASIFYYTYDGGTHWAEVIYPLDFYGEYGIKYFNGHWWMYGYGADGTDWNTVLIKSKDLVNWEYVNTPWNGSYPPSIAVHGIESSYTGTIYNLEYDPLTNTIIAVGYNDTTSSYIMISPDGGDHWFEIGFEYDDHFRTDYGFEGIYKWPADWTFDYYLSNMAYAYGWWFVANSYGTPDGNSPPIIRISIDGEISEAVYPPPQYAMYGYSIVSGGDIT